MNSFTFGLTETSLRRRIFGRDQGRRLAFSRLVHIKIVILGYTMIYRYNMIYTNWWLNPLKNMKNQIGSSSQLLGKIKCMFQTTNQYSILNRERYIRCVSSSLTVLTRISIGQYNS